MIFCEVVGMNGSELGEGSMKMEVIEKEKLVYMWGYLPGAMPQRSPLLSPIIVGVPQQGIGNAGNYSWKDVCGGGCGFAMAISGDIYIYIPSVFSLIFCFRLSMCLFGFGLAYAHLD